MERMDKAEPRQPHRLLMQDRGHLEMSGVGGVDRFDETLIRVQTSYGTVSVQGTGLHITRLDLEDGALELDGHIAALSYTEPKQGGFFARLFR